jgi:hypothetical protein
MPSESKSSTTSVTGYTCDKHPGQTGLTSYCTDCMTAFETRRDAATMTAEERAAEFEWWGSILTIPFANLHQRIEELVGRSVWTHELANPKALIREIRSGQSASFGDVLDKIPSGKPIIVIDASTEAVS